LKVEETVVQDNFVGDRPFLGRDLESIDLTGVNYTQAILLHLPPPHGSNPKAKGRQRKL
jgi:hypothetical protein